jgi:hypothetical protein
MQNFVLFSENAELLKNRKKESRRLFRIGFRYLP